MNLDDFSNFMPRETSDRLFAWLAAHGPDEWHQLAAHWVYDRGLQPMAWIVQQPECDRATAQHVFWDLSAVVANPKLAETVAAEDLVIAEYIMERWRQRGFARSELASSEDYSGRWSQQVLSASPAVPSSIAEPIAGRVPHAIEWDCELPAGIEQPN
jgi:hypothetical protein